MARTFSNCITSKAEIASTLADLPVHKPVIDANTEGRKIPDLFQQAPHLPGVIIDFGDGRAVGFSKQEFFKHMSRPFGPEVYNRRPIRLLLEHGAETLTELPGEHSIEEAADLILKRSQEVRYEPVLIRGRDGELGLIDVHSILLSLSELSASRARQMAAILDTVPEGFLMIGENFRIMPGFSSAAPAMLGILDLAGLTLGEAFSAVAPPDILARLPAFIEVLFNPDLLDRLLEPANPVRELKTSGFDGREMYLGVRFKRVRANGRIAQVLVMIEDLTLRKRLESEAAELRDAAKRRFEILTQLAGADPRHLPVFLDAFTTLLSRLAPLVETPSEEADPALKHRCHALKGEAGALGLTAFRSALHEAEHAFFEASSGRKQALAALEDLRAIASDLVRLASRLIPSTGGPRENLSAGPQAPTEMLRGLLDHAAAEACERYHKNAVVHLQGDFNQFPQKTLGLLREALPQLVRNAVIHGIEPPHERPRAGKSTCGSIIVAARPRGSFIEVIVQDDGAGLDVAALRQKAGKAAEDMETAEIAFLDGVSTASEPSELAGRGVGLGQVREAVLIHGGTISVHSEPGQFTAFQICLPATLPAHEIADCR